MAAIANSIASIRFRLEIDICSCLISKALPFMVPEKPSQFVTSPKAVLDIYVELALLHSRDGLL